MMDERRYYRKEEENYEFCKHCLHVLTRRTLVRCPNCGEPYY